MSSAPDPFLLAFSFSCLPWRFFSLLTSAWVSAAATAGRLETAEKHPGSGSRRHLPEQNLRELHRWKCKWLTSLAGLQVNIQIQPQSCFRQLFWTWFLLIKDRRSHTLSLSHIYTECFVMIYGCKGLGSGWRYSEPSLLSYVKEISNICKNLCAPGLFFHESTLFLFVLFTNKDKSAKIMTTFFLYLYHQKVLIALKLFHNINLKWNQKELYHANIIKWFCIQEIYP